MDKLTPFDPAVISWSEHNFEPFVHTFLDEKLLLPLREFLERPRKDVRSELVSTGFYTFKKTALPDEQRLLDILALCVEVLHAASLIVDDIQDNSQVRRSGPCLHVQHGIPRAINAGNWLYFWTFKQIEQLQINAELRTELLAAILNMLYGGHLGQALDLSEDVTQIPTEHIAGITESCMRLKSGALVALALELGALAAKASRKEIHTVKKIGSEFGVVLQLIDDLKNVKINNHPHAAKKTFEDLKNKRPNFIWSLASQHANKDCIRELHAAISQLPSTQAYCEWSTKHHIAQAGFKVIEERMLNLIQIAQSELPSNPQNQILITQLKNQFEKLRSSYESE